MVLVDIKQTARYKLYESVRDLMNLKLTLPLGNPNLALLHTNQFLYTELPKEFTLANMNRIGDALGSNRESRFSGYEVNRWYIEGITITNDGTSAKMELDLNPFATSLLKNKENYQSYLQAYEDAYNKDDGGSNNNNNNSSNSNTSNDKDSSEFKGGEGKTIDNKVKSIIGNETDNYKKAKLIHEWLQKNRHYSRYFNSRCGKDPDRAWKRRNNPGINCADTSTLTASMFRAAGIDCFVVHSTKHYYTVFTYKGKQHCSDATSSSRPLDYYWTPSNRNVKFKGKSSYYAKCGKTSCT